MQNKQWFKSLICLVLCAAMALGMLTPTVAHAAGTPLLQADGEKVVELPTVNKGKTIFLVDSTNDAGGVWTDKSMFQSAQNDLNAPTKPRSSPLQDADNNFRVSLSAMAFAKSIMGYASISTDAILVLDMSSLMESDSDALEAAPTTPSKSCRR